MSRVLILVWSLQSYMREGTYELIEYCRTPYRQELAYEDTACEHEVDGCVPFWVQGE